jgi:DNA-binding NtrC family response regulator
MRVGDMIDVLVVDDEPGVQEFVWMTLQRADMNCRTAATGDRALELAAMRWPDVFLVDFGLPGRLDGWQLWEALAAKARGRVLRVVLFGGDISGEVAAEARRRGACAIIRKPVSPGGLMQGVSQALSGFDPRYRNRE